jgi:hypothetical protein
MTTKTPPDSILPAHLAEIPAVSEVTRQVTKAVATQAAAREAARKARAAAEAAPNADKAALRAAVEAGKPTPKPTEPSRKAEAIAAQRRSDTASVLAREAADNFREVLVQHREELVSSQAPRVDEAAAAVIATLDTLAGQLDALAREAGVWRGLYAVSARRETTPADERTRMMGREPAAALPTFDPVRNAGAKQLAPLRAFVEELRAKPTPAPDKLAERRRRRLERRKAAA